MQSAQFQLHAEIEDRHWWFVARRAILSRVARAVVPAGRGRVVLDVGCGTGANLGALAADYQCVGIDTSAEAVRLAGQRFPQVEFRQGFAPADCRDVLSRAALVLLTDVLEHVPDDFALFSSLCAAAHPGTYFLITVPADASLWSAHDESFGHYRRYDQQRFGQIWEGLPLRTLFVSHYNHRLYPLVKLVRHWNRRQGKAHGAAGTDFRLPPAPLNRLLERVMGSESERLLRLLTRSQTRPFRSGVSLMALVQREAGPCTPRCKPAELAADYFDPQAAAANLSV